MFYSIIERFTEEIDYLLLQCFDFFLPVIIRLFLRSAALRFYGVG